jgi:hypothetical protein
MSSLILLVSFPVLCTLTWFIASKNKTKSIFLGIFVCFVWLVYMLCLWIFNSNLSDSDL